MHDHNLREEVLKSSEQLENDLRGKGVPLPTTDYDLVLDRVETKNKKITWTYYYVDHREKTLFWLEPYDMARADLLLDVRGAKEPGHISGWSLFNTPFHANISL